MSWLSRLKSGLKRSAGALAGVFVRRKLDAATLATIEEELLSADLGPKAAARVVAALAARKRDAEIGPDELRRELAAALAAILAPCEKPFVPDPTRRPHVVLVAGVNGTGKTTTIGKIAARLARD
ncbi:MAG: signal recognition particle-docking protein FtsY, partial [Alphaproteobacteria bacterium]|nr:signal recognition particle-docking protein FtsY [Alphaproteobacteria bacterium]